MNSKSLIEKYKGEIGVGYAEIFFPYILATAEKEFTLYNIRNKSEELLSDLKGRVKLETEEIKSKLDKSIDSLISEDYVYKLNNRLVLKEKGHDLVSKLRNKEKSEDYSELIGWTMKNMMSSSS